MSDLMLPFDPPSQSRTVMLDPGAMLLGGFAAAESSVLLDGIRKIAADAPFRHMTTPGGRTMSVAMTNCGGTGWMTDRRGYHYDRLDPATGAPWPDFPASFLDLASRAAAVVGFTDFQPDGCLINRYVAGARMSLHQDKDERDQSNPIVSVSLGLTAMFLWGGEQRSDPVRRFPLMHGDVVVWGGPARLIYHGIDTVKDSRHPATGSVRYNLTFRKVL